MGIDLGALVRPHPVGTLIAGTRPNQARYLIYLMAHKQKYLIYVEVHKQKN